MRPIRLLVLVLCGVGGCAHTRSSQVSNPPATKTLWRRLLPWDYGEDDKPKTQKQIDDDFKWRNNG